MQDRPARRRNRCRAGVFAALLLALALPPAPALAQDDTPKDPEERRGVFTNEEIVAGIGIPIDVLLVRPLGAAQTAIGFVLFIPAALVSAWDYPDTTREAWELFVEEPAKNVYERPLGDF